MTIFGGTQWRDIFASSEKTIRGSGQLMKYLDSVTLILWKITHIQYAMYDIFSIRQEFVSWRPHALRSHTYNPNLH